MTFSVIPMGPAELDRAVRPDPEAGCGALSTARGNLPLDRLDVQADITGLIARTRLTSEFVNVHDTALEATYVFPLPDRAAVTGMTMTADGRTVEAELRERGAAREAYDAAIASGRRASIAEEERPDVFTMRVGNILPGERVSVQLRLVGPLPYEDGAATFRFPLVVAPRYVPGVPLPGPAVGDGHTPDTDATPDASRITPPVLLPGFPNPVRLTIGVGIDPAGLGLGEVRSSLHTVSSEGNRLSIAPGERADRDFVLRLPYAGGGCTVLAVPETADSDTDGEGTYQLTVLPPAEVAVTRPRDVVLLLDRSGSMGGWTMVAARRAAARIVDTLAPGDRFAVVTFDDRVEYPQSLGAGLVAASDRNRYRAVEHLARVEARGGTELLAPLRDGLTLLAGAEAPNGRTDDLRDPVLVLVTDGQVGNEDQILRDITPLVGRTRIHAVGIDRAVNAGFLGRLASVGAGRCELVESEDRLDEAMEQIQRRIAAPVVTDLTITAEGLTPQDGTRSPAKLPGIYPGVPLVVAGRYRGPAGGALTVRGRTRDGADWATTVDVQRRDEPAVTAQWARAHLRDLEDRYVAGGSDLEQQIVRASLRFGVLCRFTAYVAVDTRVVTEGGEPHRVVQPVEPPSGWDMFAAAPPYGLVAGAGPALFSAPMAAPGGSAPAGFAGGTGAMPAPPAAAPRSMTFAAMSPGGPARNKRMSPAPRPAAAGPDPRLASLRAVVAVEARRLRDAGGLSAPDRRDLLADLASRLGTLLDGMHGPAFEPLRMLVERLHADGATADLEASWSEARRVLDAFAEEPRPGAEPGTEPAPGSRKAFWKR
jgi:Ca-activated chloride channel family protein